MSPYLPWIAGKKLLKAWLGDGIASLIALSLNWGPSKQGGPEVKKTQKQLTDTTSDRHRRSRCLHARVSYVRAREGIVIYKRAGAQTQIKQQATAETNVHQCAPTQ